VIQYAEFASRNNAARSVFVGDERMADMIEGFTSRTFTPLLGEHFEVTPATDEPVDLVLARCDETGQVPTHAPGSTGHRVPFSLLFHAPDGRLVAQQTCTVRYAGLGEFSLFLVPLGPDERGMRYEAVFA
jgi:hypothetical protein